MAVAPTARALTARRCVGIGVSAVLAAGLAAAPAQALGSAPVRAHAVTATLAAAPSDEEIEVYVQSVYADLFGREVDAAGLETWTTALRNGTPRVAVANAITSSQEFRTALISLSYLRYLDRFPEPAGLEHWLGEMTRGLTISQMEAGFISSPEFYLQSGNDDSIWVENLYATVLGREAAAEEIDFWTGRLDMGSSRYDVAMGFLLSTENLTTEVDGYYQGLLGRSIDPAGMKTWVGMLQAGGRDEAIIGGIIASDEYWLNLGLG